MVQFKRFFYCWPGTCTIKLFTAVIYPREAPFRCSTLWQPPGLTNKHQTRLERHARDKHSIYLRKSVTYACKKNYSTGPWTGSTVVEHLPGHPRAEGLSPSALLAIGEIRGQKSVYCFTFLQGSKCILRPAHPLNLKKQVDSWNPLCNIVKQFELCFINVISFTL